MHGFTTTSEFWPEQVEEFSASYQVIRLNLPGHGISPSPKTRNYTIDAFFEDLEKIFHHFSLPRAVLVGFSMEASSLSNSLSRIRNYLKRSYSLIRHPMAYKTESRFRKDQQSREQARAVVSDSDLPHVCERGSDGERGEQRLHA